MLGPPRTSSDRPSCITSTPCNSKMPKTRARPDPISCQLCRAKKLKCNRVQPCSNCLARGVTCHFLVPPPNKGAASSNSLYDRDVLRRLEFLESKLQSGSVQGATRTLPVSNGSPTSRVRGDDPSQANTTTSNSIADDDVVFDIVTREDSFVCAYKALICLYICSAKNHLALLPLRHTQISTLHCARDHRPRRPPPLH